MYGALLAQILKDYPAYEQAKNALEQMERDMEAEINPRRSVVQNLKQHLEEQYEKLRTEALRAREEEGELEFDLLTIGQRRDVDLAGVSDEELLDAAYKYYVPGLCKFPKDSTSAGQELLGILMDDPNLRIYLQVDRVAYKKLFLERNGGLDMPGKLIRKHTVTTFEELLKRAYRRRDEENWDASNHSEG